MEAATHPRQFLLETRCPRERIALLFNPAAGRERPEARRARLEALARAAGLTCELRETIEGSGAAPLARQAAADGMERLLVCGGDGTVAEAAGALAGTGTALAVLPGGTGNLLAVNLGIPLESHGAMSLALTGEARPIDLGRANGAAFLIAAGMGADARLMQEADRRLKQRLGALAYFVAAWRNLRQPRQVRYAVTIDGRTLHRLALTVLVVNLGRITGGVELVPRADPEDGLLEIAIFRARNFGDLARIAARALLGRPQRDDLVEIHRGKQISVVTASPQPVEIDGSPAGAATRLEVRVEPGRLLLVRPVPGEVSWPALPLPRIPTLSPWVPLAAGLAGAALSARLRRSRRLHRQEPGFFDRHPLLAGLGAALIALALGAARSRLRTRSSTQSETGERSSEHDGRGAAR